MGSGKTTMGKLIAEELHLPFVDTDEVLSEQEGMSCSDIICQKGQAYFRQQERNLLNSLPQNKGMVVATGGGMPCFLDNISLITSIGISLFLDWSVENLAIRLSLTDLSYAFGKKRRGIACTHSKAIDRTNDLLPTSTPHHCLRRPYR